MASSAGEADISGFWTVRRTAAFLGRRRRRGKSPPPLLVFTDPDRTPDPAALARPVNELERDQDPDCRWRRAVNDFVAGPYAAFADRFDALLFLQAPGFDVVLDWRSQQEADLLGVAPAGPNAR